MKQIKLVKPWEIILEEGEMGKSRKSLLLFRKYTGTRS